MITYQYQHGDRPLEGFVIQQAAGRGGFGEVYYALSDSGREVALKVITAYEQIELRGISQCMNLKSPHLVTIFDVKHNAQGRPFVIMEYVSGPSLRQLLDENPAGLGEQKSAFFLREIAKGLTFLHDCGIVHRDLKPGNIFYETGYVKIGDYGLSKAISTTQHSGQTITVGTVHYMAPEIGAGKYDRSIDIYAMGAVLYEMLTGVPPFIGASPSEILLKHLSAQPDCSAISEPFAGVIRRAMAKDPNERFQNVQEMVEAVFGAAHVQQSMSVFSPESLSMVAAKVTKNIAIGAGSGGNVQTQNRQDYRISSDNRAGELAGRVSKNLPDPSRDFTVPLEDSLPRESRIALTVVAIIFVAMAGAVFTPRSVGAPPLIGLFVAVAVTGAVVALSLAQNSLLLHREDESRRTKRFATGAIVALGMMVSSLIGLTFSQHSNSGTWIAMIAPFFFIDIEKLIRPDRRERVQLKYAICAGALAYAANIFTHGSLHIAIAVAAGTALAIQALSPWSSRGIEPKPRTTPPPLPPVNQIPPRQSPPSIMHWQRDVPVIVRYIWLGICVLVISAAVGFFVNALSSQRESDRNAMFMFLGPALFFTILSIHHAVSRKYFGLWNYFFRPVLICACLSTMHLLFIASMSQSLPRNIAGVAAFFFSLSLIALLVTLFIPGKFLVNRSAEQQLSKIPVESDISPFRRNLALMMAALGLCFVCGIQRFYVGKTRSGLLWLFTFGLFGVGQIIDVIHICDGTFTDAAGRKLLLWDDPPQANATPSSVKPSRNIDPSQLGLLSALSALLLNIATVLGLAIAIDLPSAISAGVFGTELAANVQQMFGGYAEWLLLVHRLGPVVIAIVLLIAVMTMLFARRRGGWTHQLRAAASILGLLAVMVLIHAAFNSAFAWGQIAPRVANHQIPEAVNVFFDYWKVAPALLAGLMMLLTVVLLAWPPRRRGDL
jgi:serine/threonine protein kinase